MRSYYIGKIIMLQYIEKILHDISIKKFKIN